MDAQAHQQSSAQGPWPEGPPPACMLPTHPAEQPHLVGSIPLASPQHLAGTHQAMQVAGPSMALQPGRPQACAVGTGATSPFPQAAASGSLQWAASRDGQAVEAAAAAALEPDSRGLRAAGPRVATSCPQPAPMQQIHVSRDAAAGQEAAAAVALDPGVACRAAKSRMARRAPLGWSSPHATVIPRGPIFHSASFPRKPGLPTHRECADPLWGQELLLLFLGVCNKVLYNAGITLYLSNTLLLLWAKAPHLGLSTYCTATQSMYVPLNHVAWPGPHADSPPAWTSCSQSSGGARPSCYET